MSEWQPIDTAPKDGRQILAYVPSRKDDKFQCANWIWETDENDNPDIGVWWTGDGRDDSQPTLWMPIPSVDQ